MIKRIIAILILTFMLGSMLAGCNGLPDEDKNPEINDDQKPSINPDDGKEESEPPITPDPILKVGTAVGDLFGDLTLETLEGGTVNTADFRGKIVILNIWATRCPPCKAELPDFNRIASEYEGEVVVIAAHEDYTRSEAPSYVETNFPDSKIIFAYDTPYGDAYYAAGGNGYIPQTVIMDQNGVIIYSDSGVLSHSTLVSIIENTK